MDRKRLATIVVSVCVLLPVYYYSTQQINEAIVKKQSANGTNASILVPNSIGKSNQQEDLHHLPSLGESNGTNASFLAPKEDQGQTNNMPLISFPVQAPCSNGYVYHQGEDR
eukprot:3067966-Ditylum_brightwellii.AAC.1